MTELRLEDIVCQVHKEDLEFCTELIKEGFMEEVSLSWALLQ